MPRKEDEMSEQDIRSLDSVFRPSSIAVIGASRKAGTVGYEIIHNLLAEGFTGAIYPGEPACDGGAFDPVVPQHR
jgi:acyl-CoA synthetase (NDP forming)